MAANRALDRAPHKIAGGLLLTAGATILLGIITAEALYTALHHPDGDQRPGRNRQGLHPPSVVLHLQRHHAGHWGHDHPWGLLRARRYTLAGIGVGHRLADSDRDRPRQATVTPRIGGIAVASLDGLVLAA